MSDDGKTLIDAVRPHAEGLWQRNNARLDEILHGLRMDMLGRDPADDCISWLTNKRFFDEQLTESFAKTMLQMALYRLARYEADHPSGGSDSKESTDG